MTDADWKKGLDLRIGRAIETERRNRDVSRKRLSEASGVSEFLLASYEAGRSRVLKQHLVEIARVLEVPPATFFSAEHEADPAEAVLGTAEAEELLALFAGLGPKDRVDALEHVRALSRKPEDAG